MQAFINRRVCEKGDTQALMLVQDKITSLYLPIKHIPQLWNTVRCVLLLAEGTKVPYGVEFYFWAVIYLLKQHADNQELDDKQVAEIAMDFSRELKILGKFCIDILLRNKIFLIGDIQELLGRNERKNDFFKSLFVQVSNQLQIQYQFKYLPLVEFLSAIYIYSSQDRLEIMKELLEKGFRDTAVFACYMVAKASCEGVIKELLANAIGIIPTDSALSFLPAVLQALKDMMLKEDDLFSLSLDMILSFVNNNPKDKQFLLSNLKTLKFNVQLLSIDKHMTLMEIIRHLLCTYGCKPCEIREALKGVNVQLLMVKDLQSFFWEQYLPNVSQVCFFSIKTTTAAIRKIIKNIKSCTFIWILLCELEDTAIERNVEHSNHELILMLKGKLNKNSFINLCSWATSCDMIGFSLLHIDEKWWQTAVKEIEYKKALGYLRLKRMFLEICTPDISDAMRTRVREFSNFIAFSYYA